MILTGEQRKTFTDACRPLMAWLNENCHPHTSVAVTQTDAELSEGVCRVNTMEYVKD